MPKNLTFDGIHDDLFFRDMDAGIKQLKASDRTLRYGKNGLKNPARALSPSELDVLKKLGGPEKKAS